MENAINAQQQGRVFTGFEEKIGWGKRIAYAGGDVACNIVFGMIGTLLTLFYSDYALINMTAIGTVMLLSRVFDGCSDIIMGIIVEKTHSRFGKARPWLLWMSLPFCISAVALFTIDPSWGEWTKIIYVAVTYNFCNTICYTAINLPYGTLSTYMTRSSHERDMLGNVRMGLSPLGKIIAVVATLPLVKLMGDDVWAWSKVMSIWAGVAFILLLINFITCKEKVNPDMLKKENPDLPKQKKLPMKKALKFLFFNQYFWAVLLLWMFQSVSFGVIGTSLPYVCKWIIRDENLYSILFLVETLTLVGGVFVCMPLVKKVGKRNLALIGAAIALAGQLIYLISPESVGMLVMISIVRSIGLAPLNAVVFGMLGDVVDFGHYKNGVRQESFICAGGSVGTKLGSGLASAIITSLLDNAGYNGALDPSWSQVTSANNMIMAIYKFGPIIIAAGVLLVLIFYKLDKKYDAMMLVLTKREWEEMEANKAVEEDIVSVTKEKLAQKEAERAAQAAQKPEEKKPEENKPSEKK